MSSKTKRNFLIYLTLLTIICGAVGASIFNLLIPERSFHGYLAIPVYFFLFGVGSIFLFDACRRSAPQKLLLVYLAIKIIKLLVSIVFLLFYCVVIGEYKKEFLLTFIAYYLIYLIFETWFFFTYELNRKKKNKKHETVA